MGGGLVYKWYIQFLFISGYSAYSTWSAPNLNNDITVDFQPWVQQLIVSGHPIGGSIPTQRKKFHRAITRQHNAQLPPSLTWISGQLWHLPLLSVQRNVVYRLLARSITSQSLKFKFFHGKIYSLHCQICRSSTESSKDMLFYCPAKSNIWKTTILEFLWPTVEVSDIIMVIFSLDFSLLSKTWCLDTDGYFITLANI